MEKCTHPCAHSFTWKVKVVDILKGNLQWGVQLPKNRPMFTVMLKGLFFFFWDILK